MINSSIHPPGGGCSPRPSETTCWHASRRTSTKERNNMRHTTPNLTRRSPQTVPCCYESAYICMLAVLAITARGGSATVHAAYRPMARSHEALSTLVISNSESGGTMIMITFHRLKARDVFVCIQPASPAPWLSAVPCR